MERSVVAFSSKSDYKDAFKEVLKTINSEKQTPKLIVFFAEAADMWYYAAEFKKNFPEDNYEYGELIISSDNAPYRK